MILNSRATPVFCLSLSLAPSLTTPPCSTKSISSFESRQEQAGAAGSFGGDEEGAGEYTINVVDVTDDTQNNKDQRDKG